MNNLTKITQIIIVFLTLILFFQSGCAVNPVTGKKELMLISESMEIEMGKEIDRGLRMEYGIYDDPQLNQYIGSIGQQLVPHCHRPNLQYHFAILDTPVQNAFAAPGGYIYITRGLMAMINSEAELATILGHELGHVNARHSAKQITRSILFEVGIALASELSKDFKKIAPISMIATQLLFLKYSRNNEYQADSLGIEYSLKSGYSAYEMVSFFNSLQRLTQSHGGPGLPNFLSTHPLTPKRIERINELLQLEENSRANGLGKLKVDRVGYINRLNGLVYGKNPKQGYVKGNTFYHPDMRFSFHMPSGWKLENTPLQVTMASPKGDAVILLKAENTSENLDYYTQKMMKEFTNPQVLKQGFRYVNGLNAFHTLASINEDSSEEQNNSPLNVQISCIRKGEIIFTFFSAAKQSHYNSFQSSIHHTVNSFKRLSNPKYIQRRPQRIVLRRVKHAQPLNKFLDKLRVSQQSRKQIAIINGMDLNQSLKDNQLVKIIR